MNIALLLEMAADAAVLQRWVRERLRSSRTPSRVEFVPALPYTETGKLLRRQVRDQVRLRAQERPITGSANGSWSGDAARRKS